MMAVSENAGFERSVRHAYVTSLSNDCIDPLGREGGAAGGRGTN
jgi:hypothetical protein